MSRPKSVRRVLTGAWVKTVATNYDRGDLREYPAGTVGRVLGRTYRFHGAVEVLHVRLAGGVVLLLGVTAVEPVEKEAAGEPVLVEG